MCYLHPLKCFNRFKEKEKKSAAHLADERAELPGGETVVEAREDGDGDDDVAEETPQVVEGVDTDWMGGGGERLSGRQH